MATKEVRNVEIVKRALDKPCTRLLQEVLRYYVHEKDIYKLLNDPAKKRVIIRFARKKKRILYPKNGVFSGSYADFDIGLLYVLIRNLTGIPKHKAGWGKKPKITDNSTAANVERIRLLRNKYSHGPTIQLSDKDFGKEWQKIITSIQEIEKTLPGKKTIYEHEANNILQDSKTQEELGENVKQCQGNFFMLDKQKHTFIQNSHHDELFVLVC